MTSFDAPQGEASTDGDPSPDSDAPTGPRDFRILTPDNWYVLDLNPATRNSSIARLVEHRFTGADEPRLVQARRELTALLRGAARDAADSGAVYAALMDALVENVGLSASLLAVVGAAPVDDDGNIVTDVEALSTLLLAGELTAMLDTATGADPAGGAANGAAPANGTAPSAAAAPAVELTDRPAGTGTAQTAPSAGAGAGAGAGERTEIVELAAGPAVRLRRGGDSELGGSTGETAQTAETQYFVPIPDTDRMLVLTFATPNVAFSEQFEELFDRIAETLEWQWELPA